MGELARSGKPPRRRDNQIRVRVSPRLQQLMDGELTVEDLDDEEIRRMQLRDKNGHFTGRPAAWIPANMAQAFKAEFYRRFMLEMHEVVPDALKAIKEQVNSRHLNPGDATRLRAAELVLERTFGKVTQTTESHVVVDKGKTFDDVLEEVLVDVEEDDE